jgi:pimeloyl-ACP methyl ester carboxylesterase
MRTFTIDIDGPINVADFGGSGRVLLLVHGLAGSHLNWLSVAPKLAAHHRVFAFDFPGFGRSPLAGRRSSIPANVNVLKGVTAQVADGPVVLVGNSMGGLISLGLAARHPGFVRALILVDPAVPTPGGPITRLDRVSRTLMAAAFMPKWGARRMSRALAALGPESLVYDVLQLCSVDASRIEQAVIDEHIALERERLNEADWQDSFYAATRSLVRVLALKRQAFRWVRGVVAPTLLVQGDKDRLVSVRSARHVALLRPDWEYHEFAGVGHVPMLEVPGEFLEVTEEWLARHEGALDTEPATAQAG